MNNGRRDVVVVVVWRVVVVAVGRLQILSVVGLDGEEGGNDGPFLKC